MKPLVLLLPFFFWQTQTQPIRSNVHVLDVASGKQQTIYSQVLHLEAPNWSRDGRYLLVNSKGALYKLKTTGGELEKLNIGDAQGCNNDHGFSFDGKWLAISHSINGKGSHISVLPADGGQPKTLTQKTPSYWHGWSPDGKTLAYCAQRDGNFDVYTIPVAGGDEKRLTKEDGLDDGPEYSPDGKFIYFNSYRTGKMQIWRMLADGSNPEQITKDELANWFAHVSPDGKWIAYISYLDDQAQNHPFGKRVKLRLMNLETRKVRDLTPEFFGGQG
ncbi:MAG: TolB family protein, partial [Mucilaginibacter polytrichastri]|nr:TolB family protein [Mucilaginibacter polytrichastri]